MLCYYERIGLIPAVNRNKSGIRDYTDEDCKWVEFIKCMRGAGLPIEVLIEYVALFQEGESTIQARKEILIEQEKSLLQEWKRCKRLLNVSIILRYLDMKIQLLKNKNKPPVD